MNSYSRTNDNLALHRSRGKALHWGSRQALHYSRWVLHWSRSYVFGAFNRTNIGVLTMPEVTGADDRIGVIDRNRPNVGQSLDLGGATDTVSLGHLLLGDTYTLLT